MMVWFMPVSYTHLDVYKRQAVAFLWPEQSILGLILAKDDDEIWQSM